ncbi:MAG TPA: hypothetical protein O0X39_07690 [Methanocorpusculum sp.]|nr:hypothetical protein [Methanocorpusculum sp.]
MFINEREIDPEETPLMRKIREGRKKYPNKSTFSYTNEMAENIITVMEQYDLGEGAAIRFLVSEGLKKIAREL